MSNKKMSARITPELQESLLTSGHMTAIVTLDSPRFKNYLKKPANLLHDRWTYLESDGEAHIAVYRLGGKHGLRQELSMNRLTKQATITSIDPDQGLEQVLIFDLRQKTVVSNTVIAEEGGSSTVHNFLFLNKREGLLREVKTQVEVTV